MLESSCAFAITDRMWESEEKHEHEPEWDNRVDVSFRKEVEEILQKYTESGYDGRTNGSA